MLQYTMCNGGCYVSAITFVLCPFNSVRAKWKMSSQSYLSLCQMTKPTLSLVLYTVSLQESGQLFSINPAPYTNNQASLENALLVAAKKFSWDRISYFDQVQKHLNAKVSWFVMYYNRNTHLYQRIQHLVISDTLIAASTQRREIVACYTLTVDHLTPRK